MEKYDLAIIGAGPVGLFAASFANLHGLKTITFDALDEVGGQINMLYPQKDIKDIPAFSSIKGKELVSRLFEQTENTKLTLSHKVKKISFSTGEDIIIDDDYQVKSLLIATGLGAFKPKLCLYLLLQSSKPIFTIPCNIPKSFLIKKSPFLVVATLRLIGQWN